MPRLNERNSSLLPSCVVRPLYDRTRVGPGIVHIGIGAFHKSHQAVYTDQAMGISGGNWGIIGVSLRRCHAEDTLNPQDGLSPHT